MWVKNVANKKTVIILGNAYGRMPYQDALCDQMSASGYNVLSPMLSGQVGGKPRHFNIANGILDLQECCEKTTTKDLYIIAHCATGIIVNEFLVSHPSIFKKAIFYSPLCHPYNLKGKVEAKFLEHSLNYDLGEREWTYSFINEVQRNKSIPFKVFVIDDSFNKHRCTIEDGFSIRKNSSLASVAVIKNGYDRNNTYIDGIAKEYVRFLEEK